VGALRCEGLVAPAVLDGAINGDAFLAYVEQILRPTLKPGDVVTMDNRRCDFSDEPERFHLEWKRSGLYYFMFREQFLRPEIASRFQSGRYCSSASARICVASSTSKAAALAETSHGRA